MATTLIPLSEYLGHSFRPDCDYVDGELQERNLGEQDHSDLQTRFVELFGARECKKYFRANTELRVQVEARGTGCRMFCVRLRTAPSEEIVRTPPLLCIEVLSPDDRAGRVRERVREFLEMGVTEVWVVDAEARSVTVCTGATMMEHTTGEVQVPGTPVVVALTAIQRSAGRVRVSYLLGIGGAGGMAMSRLVTVPRGESGPPKSASLPTTTMASLETSTYLLATRVTSAAVTFSTPSL